MSRYSPGVLQDSEQLSLFVFLPMHHIDKNGKAKPNIFSHVHLKGRSIQREDIASTKELVTFVSKFLENAKDREWKGVLLGQCRDVRNIKADTFGNRAICVYDTADPGSPAHGELCQTQHIGEADQAELRGELFAVFGKGVINPPSEYRSGTVWNDLALSKSTL